MKKKFYAVKTGRSPGIYLTWADCKAQVDGFADAKYKGFATREEAKAWIDGGKTAVVVQAQTEARPEARPLRAEIPEFFSLFDEPEPLFAEPPVSHRKASASNRKASASNHKASASDHKASASGTGPQGRPDAAGDVDYIIYTDGSCLRNPAGPGGYAVLLLDAAGNLLRELSGGEPSTTNNRMELMAGITALEAVEPGCRVALYTDSQYMQNGFVKYWLRNWKRNGWKTATGNPVSNQDLWQRLDALVLSHQVQFHWVKGHANQEYNERCDELAKTAAKSQPR